MARMTASEIRARAAQLPSTLDFVDDSETKNQELVKRLADGMSLDEAFRREEELMCEPGPASFENREFYERMAEGMEIEELILRESGQATTVYWDPETQERSYDPPLTYTQVQYETMLRQMENGRRLAEETQWIKDPDQSRAQVYRDSFDAKIEEFKKKFGSNEEGSGR